MSDERNPSRREFFRFRKNLVQELGAMALGPFGKGPGRTAPASLRLLQRPPGAVAEGQFLSACTRCGDCIEACPPRAIQPAPEAAGEARAGTPMIDALRSPCVMCDDLPCIDACEPGVLQHGLPLRMATASIDRDACLPWNGQECRLCLDHCPVPGAMELVEDDGASGPVIEPASCTGCGVCLSVCPAPRNAVRHRPLEERPFAAL
ncbi:MAG: quinol dehydrogenase [Phycisphaerae bacterium]|nr:quinol dehydrogenase [Phycisphaerae bacterium]